MKILFNLSEQVQIRLTQKGRDILKEQKYLEEWIKEDKDGWSTWQMHTLFQYFGQHIYVGCTPPFELTIRLKWD
jgi:hypothetical protein